MVVRSAIRLAACLVACAAAVLGARTSEPDQQARFRSGIDLVTVDVTVLSRTGDPITTLGASDFALTVDGKPRRIQSVRLVTTGERTAPAPAGQAGVAAAAAPPPTPPAVRSPRRFVIVVDRAHTPAGEGQSMLAAAADFVDTLPPEDQVAFWTTPGPPSSVRFENREEVKRRIRLAVGAYRPPMGPWMVGRDEAIRATEGTTSLATGDGMPGSMAEIIARECYKQPPTCPNEVQAQVREVAADARQRAEATLADLQALIDALGSFDGPKQLVLVTGGPVLTFDNRTLIASMGARAAAARVIVHALQVHDTPTQARTDSMRASPETIDQGLSASFALAGTTGGLALTPVSGEIGFKRLAHELSAGYLIVFETEDADRDGKVHQIDVKVRDRGWGTSVRARKTFRVDPAAAVAATAATTAPAASQPVAGSPAAPIVPPEPLGTDPGVMADRLADYAERFEREIAVVVAEERFVQTIQPWRGIPSGPEQEAALTWVEPGAKVKTSGPIIARRQLLSDVLLVQLKGQQWQSYRDVAEVDGRPVRDRADRVQRLFLSGSGDLAGRFQEIALESARYNLGDIRRDVNLPTVTLSLLRRVNHARFQFKRQKDETVDGRACRVLAYRETQKPTLISTRNAGDIFIYGRIWIDQADGRVLRTELRFDRSMRSNGLRCAIRTDYGRVEGFDVLLPVRMWEWYEGVTVTGRIMADVTAAQGLATYSKFRRFQVSTSEEIRK